MIGNLNAKAPAKVNLALDIMGKRPDGYHDMCMLNHSCALFDELTLTPSESYDLKCNIESLNNPESNIVTKALEALAKESGKEMDFTIDLKKNIPMEAGLAGGSADAAAALELAAHHWGLDITPEELAQISLGVGADIPYCLLKKTALVQGIGEVITEVKPFTPGGILIVKPDIAIKTRDAFSWADAYGEGLLHPDVEACARAIEEGRYGELPRLGGNSFLEPVGGRFPVIPELIRRLYESGAFYAGMSGSGSTVVGYFDSREKSKRAYKSFDGFRRIETKAFENE